jgi:hypothetical protein
LEALKFKAQVINGIIKIPQEYKEFQNSFVSISINIEKDERLNPQTRLEDNIQILDFSECEVKCFEGINPVDFQRMIRDAK